jgi:hypothetical protein
VDLGISLIESIGFWELHEICRAAWLNYDRMSGVTCTDVPIKVRRMLGIVDEARVIRAIADQLEHSLKE